VHQEVDAIELTLSAVPTAATDARTEVTERLSRRLPVAALEDVRLLLTELITNALRHGAVRRGDKLLVRAELDGGLVRIEVRDPGRDGEVKPRRPGARTGGYGLYLVDRVARRWGVEHNDGTLVWCEVASGDDR
jgi:anti-sigma regulatory factor (Ser/Thr protein kinase)